MTSITRMPRTQLLAVIAALIIVAELFANEIIAGDDPDAGGWIGLSLFGIAVAAVLVFVAVPRIAARNRRTAVLAFGIAAVITCAVFWSALPFGLAAAALAAARPGDDNPEGQREARSTAGVLLALLAIVAAFILCLVG
jgi:hypothetical protein